MGPVGPIWAPCWPRELCYLGYDLLSTDITICIVYLIALGRHSNNAKLYFSCHRMVLSSPDKPKLYASTLWLYDVIVTMRKEMRFFNNQMRRYFAASALYVLSGDFFYTYMLDQLCHRHCNYKQYPKYWHRLLMQVNDGYFFSTSSPALLTVECRDKNVIIDMYWHKSFVMENNLKFVSIFNLEQGVTGNSIENIWLHIWIKTGIALAVV